MTTAPKPKTTTGNGGARIGAGRRPGSGDTYQQLAEQRRRLMSAKAALAEIEVRKRAGELLVKHDVEVAAARMHAAVCQTLRGVPDALERRCGLPPAAVIELERAIDEITIAMAEAIQAALNPA